MSQAVDWNLCKKRLAYLWFSGSAALFALVLFQSLGGRYESTMAEAWGWFLPNIVPTLSLMIGVFVADAGSPQADRIIDSFLFHLTYSLSVAYFLIILITILAIPFVVGGELTAVGYLKTSNLWLAPLQGLNASTLGVFFVKSGQKI